MINTAVSGKSHVYGIIGCPIEHSFSPVLQNTVASMLGIESIYVPFKVEPENISTALEGALALNICGLNVTVPHKKEVMPHICQIDPLAQKIGAVNTLKRVENGFAGYNTDILGLMKCFEIEKAEMSGKTCVVIGAGGAANAAVTLAAEKGAREIFIVNRTAENAEKLKASVQKHCTAEIKTLSYNNIMDIKNPDFVIQTTSVGMGEGTWESPVENAEFFENVKFAVDVIYTPWETKFLNDARQKRVNAVNGFDMLVYQGIASFEIWNNIKISDEKAREMRNTLAEYYTKKRANQ
ncbi:MAG: shikimate dehydrogenase [Firmicutes bacterium]|nr:shikimate dehydrogenase [Bacillota bacterium]